MYSNFAALAPTCQSAVADLHDLRQQYWDEESHAHGGRGHGGFHHDGPVCFWYPILGIVALAVGLVCRKRLIRKRQNKKDMHAILTAIEANPVMKAQSESLFSININRTLRDDMYLLLLSHFSFCFPPCSLFDCSFLPPLFFSLFLTMHPSFIHHYIHSFSACS